MRSLEPQRNTLRFRLTVYREVAAYGISEFLAGHWGRHGLTFVAYMANNVFYRRYRGERLRIVLAYLVHRALRSRDRESLDIAVGRHASDLPLDLLRLDELLDLRRVVILRREQEYTTLLRTLDAELQRRQASV